MSRSSGFGLAFLAAFVLLTSHVALGQSAAGTHFGALAGPLFPSGQTSDSYKTGYQISGFVDHHGAKLPLGVRLEFGYSRLGFRSARGVSMATEDTVFGSGNVVLVARSTKLQPFVLAGLGVYRVSVSGEGFDPFAIVHTYPISVTQTKPGWQIGVGFSFPIGNRSKIFFEARYTQILTTESPPLIPSNLGQIPLLLGVSF